MREEIKNRTKRIGIEVIFLTKELPNEQAFWILTKQVIRSATSVGANYRAACRARSTKDFINKLNTVEEEADETIYWLEIIEEISEEVFPSVYELKKELNEILAIVVSSIKTARKNLNQNSKSKS